MLAPQSSAVLRISVTASIAMLNKENKKKDVDCWTMKFDDI